MSKNEGSYLKIIRDKTEKSQDTVSFEVGVSLSQYIRYEKEPSKTHHETMNIIIDNLGDEYLSYLYSMDNKVASRLLPHGVQKKTIQGAVISLAVAAKQVCEKIHDLMEISEDTIIDESEVEKWLQAKDVLEQFFRAYMELKCADGTEI